MRQLKLRAWCEKNKEMYFPNETYCFRIYNGVIAFHPHYPTDDLHTFVSENPCPDELLIDVMQFTGLKDKNGIEIYEGDYYRSDEFVIICVWIEEICCFGWLSSKEYELYRLCGLESLEDSGIPFNCDKSECNNIEIKGNIFEKPAVLMEHI